MWASDFHNVNHVNLIDCMLRIEKNDGFLGKKVLVFEERVVKLVDPSLEQALLG